MAFHLYEDTWETSTTTGTGTYTLAGAVAGWRTFASQYSNADTCLYAAFDGTNFEMGIGTYNAGTLARTTIYRSTNANAAVNWAAGTRNIMVTPLGVSMEALLTPGTTGKPRKTADNAWSFDAVGQELGIASNAAASTGNIGEVVTASGSGVALSNGGVVNVCSITLSAGDWDVRGNVTFGNAGLTTYSLLQAGWSLTNGAMANHQQIQINFQNGDSNLLNTQTGQLLLNASTSFWLVAGSSFSGGSPTCSGTIQARRMR